MSTKSKKLVRRVQRATRSGTSVGIGKSTRFASNRYVRKILAGELRQLRQVESKNPGGSRMALLNREADNRIYKRRLFHLK